MDKATLLKLASEKLGSRITVETLDAILDSMEETFANGESIYMRGFGTFEFVERKAKIGRNISMGTSVVIPAKKDIKFKASAMLKAKLQ